MGGGKSIEAFAPGFSFKTQKANRLLNDAKVEVWISPKDSRSTKVDR